MPTVLLYGPALIGGRAAGRARPWHTAHAIFGILLIPWTLFGLLEWLDATADAPLNVAWVFLAVAVAGFAAALLAGVRYGCLLGSLALVVSWLALWDEILDAGVDTDAGTLRGLLVLAALLLLVAAALVALRGGAPEGATSDIVTAAGLSAVGAGLISLGRCPASPFLFAIPGLGADTSLFWDTYLLVVSLVLVAYAANGPGRRGSAYVGGLGLVVFVIVVGLDSGDESPEGAVLGWPIVAMAAGLLAVAWTFFPGLRRARD